MDIEVTAALLRVLNGCAATEVGQRIWLKLEMARGKTVPIDVPEARFIHRWVEESISVAEELSADASVHGVPGEIRGIAKELGVLRSVQARLPARVVQGLGRTTRG